LTARQLEVLRLIADGRSTADMAVALGCSVSTVKNHAAALLGRLGARNRAEAVRLAVAAGLVTVDDGGAVSVAGAVTGSPTCSPSSSSGTWTSRSSATHRRP
jgi:DNA-binding CsgD family transcriptional regulator